jgi:hypothetical protein
MFYLLIGSILLEFDQYLEIYTFQIFNSYFKLKRTRLWY